MVVIGLLLVALVCLALGLFLQSAPWLIASLAGSAVAFLVLMLMRGKDSGDPAEKAAPAPAAAPEPAPAPVPSEVAPDATAPAVAEAGPAVYVVDGQPNYHAAECALLAGLDVEAIPRAQAVEDGFAPCDQCAPDTASPGPDPDANGDADVTPLATAEATVWTVAGRTRYHTHDCMIIEGKDAEPMPLDQAGADGLIACSLCEPNAVRKA